MNKRVKQIVERFAPGHSVLPNGGHFLILRDGKIVRDDKARPVTLPSSPSDRRFEANTLRMLRRHGVIRDQPTVSARNRGRLIRDDLTTKIDHANNHATNELREGMRRCGIWGLFQRPERRYDIGLAMSAAAGVEQGDCHQILLKLASGQNLVPADREPVEILVTTLTNREDPIKSLYELVRRAKGLLPTPQEEVVATTTTPKVSLSGPAETIAKSFLSTLREQREAAEQNLAKLEEEIKGYDQLIDFIDSMFSGSTTETAETQVKQISLSGDEQPTDGVHKDEETFSHVAQLSSQNQTIAEKVMGLVSQGGEWTQRQMYEELNVSQPTMGDIVNALVQDGKLVVVEPRSGPNPASYGSAEIYSK